jgi:two-component sensor histidine kinase
MKEALIDFFSASRSSSLSQGDFSHPPSRPITLETIFRALDLVPTPILVGMDPASTDIRSNAAGRELFGGGDRNLSQSAAEADRPDFVVYHNGALVPAEDLPMQRASSTGMPVQAPECELRFNNGVVKYIRGKAVPVFGRDGAARGSIGVFMDVTEVRDAEKRHALMTEEVKHRAKNTLSLVLAIARLTLKPKLSPDDYDDFQNRLQVIGRSVDISADENDETRNIKDYITGHIQEQIGNSIDRVQVSGPEMLMPLRSLTSVGMAIHELTTNACKYGALSVPTGSVSINWSTQQSNLLALEWIERDGPRVIPPTRKGFGSRLLSQVLGAPGGKPTQIIFGERGVECRLFVALD